MEQNRKANWGRGGTYQIIDGERVLLTQPTQQHPEGSAPRDRDGNRTDRPTPKPKTAKPKAKPSKKES